jgi:spore germination protein GerM
MNRTYVSDPLVGVVGDGRKGGRHGEDESSSVKGDESGVSSAISIGLVSLEFGVQGSEVSRSLRNGLYNKEKGTMSQSIVEG